jgi:hypothetical protein
VRRLRQKNCHEYGWDEIETRRGRMQRSVWKLGAVALLGLLVGACANEGVGDPCIPETIPCSTTTNDAGVVTGKKCGFNVSESYIESSSVQCRSRLCIVHNLDNKSGGQVPADPTKVCGESPGQGQPAWTRADGCVTEDELSASIFCTCRCDGPSTSVEFCSCPSGFSCQEILSLGGDGIRGSYCVRKGHDAGAF